MAVMSTINVVNLKTFLSFGLIMSAAFTNGKLAKSIKLPTISGFLFTGLIAGPSVLGFLKGKHIQSLQWIDHLALSLIALMAGAELKIEKLKHQFGSLAVIMIGLTLATMAMTAGACYYLSPFIPALSSVNQVTLIAASLLLGTIMVARSPSAAIALIDELGAKGRFTQLVLGVTVLMDVMVIGLFATVLALSKSLISGQELASGFVLEVGIEITLSCLMGWFFAKLLELSFRFSPVSSLKKWIHLGSLFMLALGLNFMAESLHMAHLQALGMPIHFEPLLSFLFAGLYIHNFTQQAFTLEERSQDIAPYVYVLFFTITGASLALDQLLLVWPLALVLFAVRLCGLAMGSTIGGWLVNEPRSQHRFRWMGFVTQAGVGLGLAKKMAYEFPDWGLSLSTLIIAVIVLNEVVGPFFFKYAIIQSGEVKDTQQIKP